MSHAPLKTGTRVVCINDGPWGWSRDGKGVTVKAGYSYMLLANECEANVLVQDMYGNEIWLHRSRFTVSA